MSQRTHLQTLIVSKTRRLQKLKEQEAIKGMSADPAILLEIEDLESEINALQAERDNLPAGDDDSSSTNFQPSASRQGDSAPAGQRIINTGGGAYIEGAVNTAGGDFVGRDQITNSGLSADEVTKLFEQIYRQIEAHKDLGPDDKADLKAEVEEVQAAVTKEGEVDESFLARRLRHIKRMAPDILDIVVATLANPAAGFSAVAAKVAKKAKEG